MQSAMHPPDPVNLHRTLASSTQHAGSLEALRVTRPEAVGLARTKFLGLCQQYGAERLAVRIVAAGRSAGVAGLPEDDDWTAWNADEMRAAVEHLQRKRGA